MEAVERLEACVDRLLGRYEGLKSDNERLAERLARLAREKAELEESVRSLRGALERAEARRERALGIVDALLRGARTGLGPDL